MKEVPTIIKLYNTTVEINSNSDAEVASLAIVNSASSFNSTSCIIIPAVISDELIVKAAFRSSKTNNYNKP